MRIETIEKTVYNYDDLLKIENESLKQKVLENLYDINIEHINNITDDDEIYQMTLNELGFLNVKMYYDCGYSQGSGACFDCNEFDCEILLKDYKCKHKKWIMQILQNYYTGKIQKKGNSNLYSHAYTRYFNFDGYLNTYNECKLIESIINDIENHIENKRVEACKWLYKALCNDFEYLQSDNAILETIQANNYEFDENGKII